MAASASSVLRKPNREPIVKRILVTSAGGSPATNFVRSLRDAPEPFHLVGIDANKFTLQRAETDQKFLVPKAKDPAYVGVLQDIVKETGVEFIHCQMSYEMLTISALREARRAHLSSLTSHD